MRGLFVCIYMCWGEEGRLLGGQARNAPWDPARDGAARGRRSDAIGRAKVDEQAAIRGRLPPSAREVPLRQQAGPCPGRLRNGGSHPAPPQPCHTSLPADTDAYTRAPQGPAARITAGTLGWWPRRFPTAGGHRLAGGPPNPMCAAVHRRCPIRSICFPGRRGAPGYVLSLRWVGLRYGCCPAALTTERPGPKRIGLAILARLGRI